jgi:Phage tail lysozyme
LRFRTALPKKAFTPTTNSTTGQPAQPVTLKKTALRAAKIAPAVVVAGALVAAVAAHGSSAPAPSAAVNRADVRQDHLAAHRQDSHSAAGHGSAMTAFEVALNKAIAKEQAAKARAARKAAARMAAHEAARKAAARHAAALAAVGCHPRANAAGMLPQNYAAIVDFLTAHGYTKMAAAGIAGNMYQESGGNPESVGSGGGGLIGFTPLPGGYVTGNVAADLHTQLEAVLTYNQQWAAYIPALNAATSAADAAAVYMNDFERPGIPAAYNREGAAAAVAAACGF